MEQPTKHSKSIDLNGKNMKRKKNYASNGIRAERRKLIFKKCCDTHTDTHTQTINNLNTRISCFIYNISFIVINAQLTQTHRTHERNIIPRVQRIPIASMPHIRYEEYYARMILNFVFLVPHWNVKHIMPKMHCTQCVGGM